MSQATNRMWSLAYGKTHFNRCRPRWRGRTGRNRPIATSRAAKCLIPSKPWPKRSRREPRAVAFVCWWCPFPDDAETRLRLRYSVQMALAAENFAPENRNALGYINYDPSRGGMAQAKQRYIAYEWFVPRTKLAATPCAPLVLWLPEGLLSN